MTRAVPVSARAQRRRSLVAIYWTEFRNEVLKNVRMPVFLVSSLAFPLMFYALFGLIFGRESVAGVTTATYMLATFGTFGVMGAALFGFGVGVATERGQGWMVLKRASPMPPLAYFAAKTLLAVMMGGLITLLLFVLGGLIGGVSLPLGTLASMFGILVSGAIPFCAMGLAFGYMAGPNSAPILVNLIYLPMGFFGGLWMPLPILPAFIQGLAPWLPSYHFGQLALSPLGAQSIASPWPSVAYLAAFTAIFLALATVLYRRDRGRPVG